MKWEYDIKKRTQSVNMWLNKVTNYQEKEISYGYLIALKTREISTFSDSSERHF